MTSSPTPRAWAEVRVSSTPAMTERGQGHCPTRCRLSSSIATMTTSSGTLSSPRRRKRTLSDAAVSEGTNQVTTTSRMLATRISAVLMACDLFRIIRLTGFSRLRVGRLRTPGARRIEVTIDRAAVYAKDFSRARFIALRFGEDQSNVAAIKLGESRAVIKD